ncbi:MAG TPA: hypothetical protein VGS23_08060, partial [Thermoplasmata archaeon]|nr:hypothetical protein [Thermoplasmata archaeon]
MAGGAPSFEVWEAALLLVGFGIAAYFDWRTREVSDTLWGIVALVGVVIGIFALAPSGAIA